MCFLWYFACSVFQQVEMQLMTLMLNTCESWIPPSPDLDKVKLSFDKLNNTDLFFQYMGFI